MLLLGLTELMIGPKRLRPFLCQSQPRPNCAYSVELNLANQLYLQSSTSALTLCISELKHQLLQEQHSY